MCSQKTEVTRNNTFCLEYYSLADLLYWALSYTSLSAIFLKLLLVIPRHLQSHTWHWTLCSREHSVCQPTVCASVIAGPNIGWCSLGVLSISYLSPTFEKIGRPWMVFAHDTIPSWHYWKLCMGWDWANCVAHMVHRFGPAVITFLLSNHPQLPSVTCLNTLW